MNIKRTVVTERSVLSLIDIIDETADVEVISDFSDPEPERTHAAVIATLSPEQIKGKTSGKIAAKLSERLSKAEQTLAGSSN